ncbi:MAG: glycosyltransferase 61 family protein [Granulosicoccus sp.]
MQSEYFISGEKEPSNAISLQEAFEALQALLAQNSVSTKDIDIAFQRCADAEPQADYLHRVYRDIGKLALDTRRLEMAEAFAIRSLRSLPRYGEAFKLLGLVLRAAGRREEASICHRYGLPQSILVRWFSDQPLEWVQSDEVEDGSVTCRVAFPATSVMLTPPGQWREQRIVEFCEDTLDVLEAHTVAVTGGALWFDTFHTVLWDSKGRIVRDACRGFAEVVHGSLDRQKTHAIEGRIALLGNRNADNYYHWMNDILPALAVLENSGYPLDDIDCFVVNRLKHPFQFESLKALGIEKDRLHYANSNSLLSADEILVPHYGSNSLGMSQGRWNPDFLNRVFAPETKPAPTLKLYISRGSTGARAIGNEAELITLLESHNFQIVRAETLSIREQAELYSAASVVLGPHGAGLSNIAFCQPGTRVIELFNAHIAPCFWAICEVMELQHFMHFCGEYDEVARPSDTEEYHRSADSRRVSPFSVHLPDIEQVLLHAGVISSQ